MFFEIFYLFLRLVFSKRVFSSMSATDWNTKGNEYLTNANYEQALACYTKALNIAPHASNASVVLANKGCALYFLGRLDESLLELNKAVAIEAKNPYALGLRGIIAHCTLKMEGACHFLKNDIAKAIEDCDNALLLNPKEAEALYNRGANEMSFLTVQECVVS